MIDAIALGITGIFSLLTLALVRLCDSTGKSRNGGTP